jgi:beta-lactamase regulating signal transducer with metallopeptidase domain
MTEIFSVQLAVDAVGSAILHSLWQGAVLGILTALVLRALQGSAANVRYAVACLGLAAFAFAWLTTAIGAASRIETSQPAALPTHSGPAPSDTLSPASASSFPAAEVTPNVAAAPRPWTERLESWARAAVPLWFIGVLALSLRLGFGWLCVARIRRAANEPLTGLWPERVRALAGRLRISTPVRIAQSAIVQVPMLIGWVRPVILIPASVVSGLTIAQLEAVIAHELAHVRRHDYLANIVQTAAEILLFYHPACWWISNQIRAEREHACDDVAVSVCGDRVLYAEALADLETLRSETPVLGLAATDGVLKRRIRRLVAAAPVRRGLSPGWAAAAVPLLAFGLILLNTNIAGTAVADTEALQTPTSAAERPLASDEAVVRGQVVDARSGRPVPNARVVISSGARSEAASTNDLGRYEVSGLAPGDYSVEVRAQGYVPARYGQREATEPGSTLEVRGGRYTTGVNVRLEPAGVVTGRVFDDRGEGLAGVEVELLADRLLPGGITPAGVGFAQTEAEGAFRINDVLPGDYYLRAHASPSVRPSRVPTGQAYVSTFYPGVLRSEYGQRLHLSSGQELFGIDFPLATAPTRRVAGIVVDPSEGPRPRTRVHLRAIGLNSVEAQYDATVESTGQFEVKDVVPGDYMLSVFQPGSMTGRWISTTQVVAVDDDVVDLELRPQVGAHIDGRVVRDQFATRSLDPAGVNVVFEYRMSAGGPGSGWTGIIARGANGAMRIGSNGGFSIESPGGLSWIRVSDLPPNWTLKAVRLDGADITDQPVDFGQGSRRIEIVLTDRVSIVRGNVMDRSGRPMSNVTVVLFADDPTRWEGESSRFVRETRSGRDGSFELTGLPPGDHLAVAIENLRPRMNTEVLNRLRPLATRFRLDEGGEHVVSLRVSPAPDELIPALVR